MEDLRLIMPCKDYIDSYTAAYQEDVNFRSGEAECLCSPETVIEIAYQYLNGIDIPQ